MHTSHLSRLSADAYSDQAARRYVSEISRHHRIQASPGYRAAATWIGGDAT